MKPLTQQRKTEMRHFKAENMITPSDCIAYNTSNHVIGIIKLLETLKLTPEYQFPKSNVCKVRNYLCFILTTLNALRSSNLMNITIEDLVKAKEVNIL